MSKSLVSRIAKEMEEKGIIRREARDESEITDKAPKKSEEARKREAEKDLDYVSAPPAGSPLRGSVVANVTWWEEATQELGKRAAMLALQVGNSEEDIEKALEGFKSADEFVEWATNVLHMLATAKKDASAILLRQCKGVKRKRKGKRKTLLWPEIYSTKQEEQKI